MILNIKLLFIWRQTGFGIVIDGNKILAKTISIAIRLLFFVTTCGLFKQITQFWVLFYSPFEIWSLIMHQNVPLLLIQNVIMTKIYDLISNLTEMNDVDNDHLSTFNVIYVRKLQVQPSA